MKKSLATLTKLAVILCLTQGVAFADFKEHYDLGQTYMTQYQYSGAIEEFRSALRINYMDNSARIGLINAFLSRGTEYANKDRNFQKAADDFRSALFFMMYYPKQSTVQNSASTITKVQNNLDSCLLALKYDTSSTNRFNTAKKLKAEGNFSAAAYEFMQALGNKDLQKDSFEQVASVMKILGNEPKAIDYYKKTLAIDPNDLSIRLTYAKLLDKQEQDDLALKEYSHVLAKSTADDKDILYTLERTFSHKLSAHPSNANFNANMGAILQKEGRFDEALTYYKQAESLDPSNINTRINTGTLHQQKGDYRTAIKAYESVLILYPNNVNALLYRAQCQDAIGENKAAQEGYKKVLALDPSNETIKMQMVNNVKKTLTPDQFVNYVNDNMANMNPSGIIYDYALELHKKNELEKAIYMYKEALKADSKNPEIYVNLSLAQAQNNQFEESLNTLNNAKTLFPTDATVTKTAQNISSMQTDNMLNKAAEYYQNKDYQNAITQYLAITPATANTMLGVAASYQELGDKDNAIVYYEKALELKPIDSDIAYTIACLYGEKEDYAKTKDYLQKAIVFNKNNTSAIEYLKSIESAEDDQLLNDAITLYESNNYDESLTKFNQILSKTDDNAYALYYRGMIYDAKEKKAEAISDYKKAYELNKDLHICNYLIASDYDTLGKFKEAYDYYNLYANLNIEDDEYKQYAKARSEELKEYAN